MRSQKDRLRGKNTPNGWLWDYTCGRCGFTTLYGSWKYGIQHGCASLHPPCGHLACSMRRCFATESPRAWDDVQLPEG